jgi:hypothetical protein
MACQCYEGVRPPDGVGLFVREKVRYRRPIILTEPQLLARRANAAKATIALRQAHLDVRLGLRPKWSVYPVPIKHRCQATSKQTKQRCRRWAMRKPGGGYFATCCMHGAPGALGRVEHKVIYGRRMGPKQIARFEKKWRERAEAFDGNPSRKLRPLY